MKKYLYLALMCLLSAGMFMSCDPVNPTNPTDEDNPAAGTDGYWCWKLTTVIPMEGTDDYVEVEYTWDTEEHITQYVATMNEMGKESGTTVKYEKSTAKDKNECQKLDDEQGGGNGGEITDWTLHYQQAEPGIYMNGNDLLAKGTDGSIFHIDDVTSMQIPGAAGGKECIPNNWHAYDGKMSTYFFWMDYYNDNDGNWQTYTYQDTVFYKNQTEWSSKEDALRNGGITYFMFFKDYKKVDEAGDFEQTYINIAKRVQVRGPIVPPSKMVLQYKKYNCQWLSDFYPADMEAKGYVFKYTGAGSIFTMEVDRVFEWGASVNNPKVAWLPKCDIDDVAYVIVDIRNAKAEEVKAYIAKIKAEGHYTRIVGDIEADGIISFEADSWDWEAPEGSEIAGYVYPTYTIFFTEDGMLRIEFTVAKVGYV